MEKHISQIKVKELCEQLGKIKLQEKAQPGTFVSYSPGSFVDLLQKQTVSQRSKYSYPKRHIYRYCMTDMKRQM